MSEAGQEGATGEAGGQEGQADQALLAEAHALGWADKDQWRGDPEAWVDAATFVKKGREIVPMLRKNNEKLLQKTQQTDAELARTREQLKAMEATVKALEESRQADVQAQVEARLASIRSELAQANRDGDYERAAELTEELTDAKAKLAAPAKKEEKSTTNAPSFQIPPEIQTWYTQNAEFAQNSRKLALANVIGAEIRAENPNLLGVAFLEEVKARVEQEFGGVARPNKTAGNGGGSRSSAGGGGGGGKSYADLPAEAKAACEKMAKTLVGPDRAHKTIDSWRKVYTEKYFQQGE